MHSTSPVEELLIASNEELEALIKRLSEANATRCAVDLEADSLHSYREKLCLIQMSCNGLLAIIDPLKIDDEYLHKLLDFWSERELWFHGADFDMTLLQRTFGRVPERILDTQLASRLIGAKKFGLANLVFDHFEVSLSKSSQKADWGARPIKEKMLAYAYDDVRYLLELADQLTAKLEAAGRWEWFEEWSRESRKSVLARKERTPDEVWRIPGWGKLERRGLTFLRELWLWRDEESQSRDCPPFKVLNNQTLLQLAERAGSGAEVKGFKGLHRSQTKRFQAAIARAVEVPQNDWPKRRLRRGGQREEFDADAYNTLRAQRDERAEKTGIDPTIVATRSTLETLANSPEAAETLLMKWQHTVLFGEG